MHSLFTRMSMLVITFGFFISCSKAYEPVFSPKQPEVSAQDLLDQAYLLRSQNPDSPEAGLLEGQAYAKLARDKSPSQRQDDYRVMKELFTAAQSPSSSFRPSRSVVETINQTLSSSWSLEHNSGAGIISSDSARTVQRLRNALAHAQNAVIIQPDSLISYELMADAYALLGEPERAIQTLLMADSLHRPVSQRIHEHIAFLFMNAGNAEDAIAWYESALSWQQSQAEHINGSVEPRLQRGNLLNTWHGLINAYIEAGQSDNAITSLGQLLALFPDNTSYRSVLSTQLVSRIAIQVEHTSVPDRSMIANTIDKLTELVKSNPDALLTVASNLTTVATTSVESKLSESESYLVVNDLAIKLVCDAAIQMYQKVLSSDPTNTTAISGLADTYLVLGNEEEASKWFELLN